MQLAFIGLGVMGYPMAGHLQSKGHQVSVYNRTQSKALKWQQEYQGQIAISPKEAATNADYIFTCVGNDDDLKAVILGAEGAFSGMKKGAVLVDHSTTSAEIARTLSSQAELLGLNFIDAPVSGGQIGAQRGQLSIMLGGQEQLYKQLVPILDCYAKAHVYLGLSGNGQLGKMVNQIAVAGLIQALAESVNFAQQANLDIDKLFPVLSEGAAGSWQMKNRYKSMASKEFDFGFAVDWMHKDLQIALNEAQINDASLPITETVDGFYQQIQQNEGGRLDTSSLITRLESKLKSQV